jgi:hypothetical protein
VEAREDGGRPSLGRNALQTLGEATEQESTEDQFLAGPDTQHGNKHPLGTWRRSTHESRVKKAFDKCSIYAVLTNPLYAGLIRHKDIDWLF